MYALHEGLKRGLRKARRIPSQKPSRSCARGRCCSLSSAFSWRGVCARFLGTAINPSSVRTPPGQLLWQRSIYAVNKLPARREPDSVPGKQDSIPPNRRPSSSADRHGGRLPPAAQASHDRGRRQDSRAVARQRDPDRSRTLPRSAAHSADDLQVARRKGIPGGESWGRSGASEEHPSIAGWTTILSRRIGLRALERSKPTDHHPYFAGGENVSFRAPALGRLYPDVSQDTVRSCRRSP